jgi:hypothetical protein
MVLPFSFIWGGEMLGMPSPAPRLEVYRMDYVPSIRMKGLTSGVVPRMDPHRLHIGPCTAPWFVGTPILESVFEPTRLAFKLR